MLILSGPYLKKNKWVKFFVKLSSDTSRRKCEKKIFRKILELLEDWWN